MKSSLTWENVLRAVGLIAFFVGVSGLQWPPHVLGSVVIAALGALTYPDAKKRLESRGDGK